MSAVLRAWFVSEVADAGGASVPRIIFDEAEAFALGGVPVLLIPDDGTHRVVGREEWARHEAMREAMTEFVGRVESGDVISTYTYGKFRTILGTGGGHDGNV